MHRSWSILLATTALLAGCSSGSSAPTTVTVTSPAPSGDSSVVTDRHPTNTDLFSSQFHPCEVFTEEQFAQAGLGVRSRAAENPDSVVKSCGFGLPGPNVAGGNVLVATDKIDMAQVETMGFEPELWSEVEIDRIYTHKMPGEVRRCGAAMDFDWGRFLISYQEFGEGWDRDELCPLPVSVLESLISQSGGNHGT